MGYFGIRQPSIFTDTPIVGKKRKIKYQKSGLTDSGAKKVYESLIHLMQEEKPFLEPDLTLFTLAEMINIPPNHLSQVINSLAGKNFFDFINYYRVEEAKRNIILQKYEHLTLLGIAFESGFNSKASFNRAFKRQVGITPSEFKKLDIKERNI
jgi:AraC-like DNA-binding protein